MKKRAAAAILVLAIAFASAAYAQYERDAVLVSRDRKVPKAGMPPNTPSETVKYCFCAIR